MPIDKDLHSCFPDSRWDRYLESCNIMESEDLDTTVEHTTPKEKFEKFSKRPQPYTNRKRCVSQIKIKTIIPQYTVEDIIHNMTANTK